MTSWLPSWNYDISEIRLRQIDAYLLEEQSCQISSRSDLKRRTLRVFWSLSPQQQEQDEFSDMRSVPDLKDGKIFFTIWRGYLLRAQMSLQFEVDHEFVGNMPQLMTEQPWFYNDTLLTGQTVSQWRLPRRSKPYWARLLKQFSGPTITATIITIILLLKY